MDSSIRRLAVIADVHGNIWALEAVLQDIALRGIGSIVNLGDHLYGPLEPLRTMKLLQSTPMVFIRGNCDRLLYEDSTVSQTMQHNREMLSDVAKAWLRDMPATQIITSELFLCHATPRKDDVCLLEEIEANGVKWRTSEDVEQLCAGIDAALILCGHSHQPGELRISGNRTAVNVGSVGLQAYTDDLPFPHAMQAGSPHARYAVITRNESEWKIERIQVEYDWEKASKTAARNQRKDWAEWLLSGRAKI